MFRELVSQIVRTIARAVKIRSPLLKKMSIKTDGGGQNTLLYWWWTKPITSYIRYKPQLLVGEHLLKKDRPTHLAIPMLVDVL